MKIVGVNHPGRQLSAHIVYENNNLNYHIEPIKISVMEKCRGIKMNGKITHKKILLTAFLGSSAELLIKDIDEYKTLFLPNDKIKDSEKLIKMISDEKYGYVIAFGQRPNIKNKVHIETTAKRKENSIDTEFDCERLKCLFEKNGITAKISHNAGTSFCNELYYNGLKYIYENKMDTKMVFVHIPFEKNIDEFEDMKRKIWQAIMAVR